MKDKIKKLKYTWKEAIFDAKWDLEVQAKINEIIDVLNSTPKPKGKSK